MNRFFLLMLTIVLCIENNKVESEKETGNILEFSKKFGFSQKNDDVNCFEKEDGEKIMELLDFFRNSCLDEKKNLFQK